MCVDKYGLLKLLYGIKLPKCDLSYNTRDLIHSLAKSTCERKMKKSLLTNEFRFRTFLQCVNLAD